MAQIETYKIEDNAVTPFRESDKIEIEAIFGIENTVSVTLENAVFVNSELHNNSDTIRSLFAQNPFQGARISLSVSETDTNVFGYLFNYNFKFFTDWNNLIFNAENETSVGLIKENSVIAFEERAKSITFPLLEETNFLTPSDRDWETI